MQLVGAIQNMYTPICNGIYPFMIRNKSLKFIKAILFVFTPVICIGAIICSKLSPLLLTLIAGENYLEAVPVFRMLLPVIIMSFPVAILGWPALGAINKVRETTLSTVCGAITQIVGLFVLIVIDRFSLMNIAVLRIVSEFSMLFTRAVYLYKYRNLFENKGGE